MPEQSQHKMLIPLTDIYIGKRRRKDYGNVEQLAEDFKANGQITAITVRPPNDEDRVAEDYTGEPWTLVAGGRRMMAAMRAGWDSIAAFDREEMDPLTHRICELQENLERKEMSFLEVTQAKKEMFELRKQQNPEITQAEVAREIGETPANFSRDINVAEAVERRPELALASSKKAVLRQVKMADHLDARIMREESAGVKLGAQLLDRLVTANASDWLRTIPTGSVDLVFTDPPYGIDYYKQGHKMLRTEQIGIHEYDDGEQVSQDLFYDTVPEMIRVTRDTGWIVCFMGEANYEFLKMLFQSWCTAHGAYKGEDEKGQFFECLKHKDSDEKCEYLHVEEPRWIWYRPNSQNNPRYPELHAKNVFEHLVVVNRGRGRILRPCDNVLCYNAEYGSRIHAMQKPLPLCKDIISRLTLSGESVIDPFFGSGALLAAAADLLRDFRGCEKNPALLAPAQGYVSEHFSGVAERGTYTVDAAPEPETEQDFTEEEFDELDLAAMSEQEDE